MGKGKLGGSVKGAKLTIFPCEEAELCGELTVGKGSREKGARPLQGLLVGQGGRGQGGERQPDLQAHRNRETC